MPASAGADDDDLRMPVIPESQKPENMAGHGGGKRDLSYEKTLLSPEAVEQRRKTREEKKPKHYWAQVASQSIGLAKSFCTLVFLPFCCFTLIAILCCFWWHTHYELIILLSLLVVALGLVMCLGELNATTGGRFYMFLGALCIMNIAAGFLVGINVYSDHMWPYYKIMDRTLYQNVLPSSPANAYADAGQIYFAMDARIDIENSVGFKINRTYCVAPIVSKHAPARVSFWAVGVDCCTGRAQFWCPFANDPLAHGGAVIMDAHPFSVEVNKKLMYTHAAKQAAAVYSLVVGENPIFVQWDRNPDDIMTAHYKSGLKLTTTAILVNFGICVVFAIVFQYAVGKIQKQQDADKEAHNMHRDVV